MSQFRKNLVRRSGGAAIVAILVASAFIDRYTRTVQADTASAMNEPLTQPVESALHEMAASEQRVQRGKYLVTVVGCSDCHTPFKMTATGPAPDMDRYLSGHPQQMKLPPAPPPSGPWLWHGSATNTAFAGPWGVTYAANLTPDPDTGILHVWDDERFVKALRTGKHFGEARPILPPMPWPAIGQMNDEDLKSIFAYLKSIRPVKNMVPDYEPPAKH